MPAVILITSDDVSTDTIYPGRFMATVLPNETPLYAFADHAEFNKRLNQKEFAPGSIIIGGHNFGCGSSREQAVSCLKGHELIVIARSFARIFLQNAINLGLQVVTAPDVEAKEEDTIEINETLVFNKNSNKKFAATKLAPTQQAVMEAGGLIPYTRKKLI